MKNKLPLKQRFFLRLADMKLRLKSDKTETEAFRILMQTSLTWGFCYNSHTNKLQQDAALQGTLALMGEPKNKTLFKQLPQKYQQYYQGRLDSLEKMLSTNTTQTKTTQASPGTNRNAFLSIPLNDYLQKRKDELEEQQEGSKNFIENEF